jgi:hypothetical protein
MFDFGGAALRELKARQNRDSGYLRIPSQSSKQKKIKGGQTFACPPSENATNVDDKRYSVVTSPS